MAPTAPDVRPFTPRELLGRPLNDVEDKDAPRTLFAVGDETVLREAPTVSIVGTRDASAHGVDLARRLATWLVQQRIVVVSGLAEGIDTTAHMATITAHGRTVAVGNVIVRLLSGDEPCAPTAHHAGAPGDLTVSASATGGAWKFSTAQQIMALLSDATVIIEAKDKSGSLHQAWEALRLGRPLFIMQSQRADPTLAWPRELERYGAQVLDADQWDALHDALPEKSPGVNASLTL